MISMTRTAIVKATAAASARRHLSSSISRNQSATVTLTMASEAAAPSSSASSGTAKMVAYTVLGSTAVIAGVARIFKDEVVYWTPNARK
ncbi:hypothetical protein BGZ94_006452 [Podila epigama]|nr:hypothetical protein BGZ94_006452 [Podila epigama]